MAPEFYDHLKFHSSWSRLLFQFIFDPTYTLFSRIERAKGKSGPRPSYASQESIAPVAMPAEISVS
jgi:sphingolipid delta-4 desaturase